MLTPYKPILENVTATKESFLGEFTSINDEHINDVPEPGSWSAAQVAVHVTKSVDSIAMAVSKPGKKATRKPDEKVAQLEALFLDFSTKMKSPEMLIPAMQDYKKEELIENIKTAFNTLLKHGIEADLTEVSAIPGLGKLTKYELLNFAIVHTKRHTHQLHKVASLVQ